MYKIMSSMKSDGFISSFMIWLSFISFSCLTALAKTSNTMLMQSGDDTLVSNLKVKVFTHLPLNMMIAISFSYMSLSG